MVSTERIEELRQIIKEDYGRDLSLAEAQEIGSGLVGYYDLLARLYHDMQPESTIHKAFLASPVQKIAMIINRV